MPIKIGGLYDRSQRDNDIKANTFLQVNCCGIYEKALENRRTFRPNGRQDYQLILIEDGNALFHRNSHKLTLKSREMLIIPPGECNDYQYSEDVFAMWIHFSGTAIASLLNDYAMAPFTCYRVGSTSHFFVLAEQIIREFQLQHVGYANNCNGLLLQLLTLAKRRIDTEADKKKQPFPLDLSNVLEDMKTNFSQYRDISVYAKMCNISQSHFIHNFTRQIGMSPYKYLSTIRIDQAKYLLNQTDLSIRDISENVGFDDPLYFSKFFRKQTGVSPKQYRSQQEKLRLKE